MSRIRNLSVGKKLFGSFGIVVALLLVVTAVGIWGGRAQSASTSRVEGAARIATAAGQVKFRAADFNGWQTAYAFDVIRGENGATSDSAPSRKAFLASAAAFGRESAALAALPLAPEERRLVDGMRRSFRAFMQVDRQVIADYRQGTPAATEAANGLVLGKEIRLFTTTSHDADALVRLAQAHITAEKASASHTPRCSTGWRR
jgi:methyl-accepting chemotaxis protein